MLSKIAELFIFGLTPFMICGIAVPAMFARDVRLILGKVETAAPVVLPPDAAISVHLLRPAASGFPEMIIAEELIRGGGSSPFEFALAVERDALVHGGEYIVQAAIRVGSEVRFRGEAACTLGVAELAALEVRVEPMLLQA